MTMPFRHWTLVHHPIGAQMHHLSGYFAHSHSLDDPAAHSSHNDSGSAMAPGHIYQSRLLLGMGPICPHP